MAEQIRSITDARQNLTGLSQSAQQDMERYVITNQGRPQSVLVGYEDYRGMQAATELAHRPDAVESIRRGMEQLSRGERLTPAQMMEKLGFSSELLDAAGAEVTDPSSTPPGAVRNGHAKVSERRSDKASGAYTKARKAPASRAQAI
jgi:prevent-host-death family protein